MTTNDPGHVPGSSSIQVTSSGRSRRRVWVATAVIVVGVLVIALAVPAGLHLVKRSQAQLPWPPPARSGVEVMAIDSQALGITMPALVWVPPGTDPDDRLPLVVLFHGQGGDASVWFHGLGADLIATRLIAEGRIPPVVLVSAGIANSMGVDSTPADDGYDHGAYGTYLADELIPAIVDRYPVTTDPRQHHAAGLSMGGYAALHLVFRHPDRFGGVGGLSPAVALGIQPERAWLYRDEADRDARDPQRLAQTSPLADVRVFLGAGAADYDWIVAATQELAARLEARGMPVRLAESPPTGHDGQTWQALTGPMLETLLSGSA
jgi:enterochelin esterase-like enzyme